MIAFVGIANFGQCLCLEQRIVASRDEATADNIFAAALMSVLLTASISAAVLAGLMAFDLLGYGKLPVWCVPLIGAMILLNGTYAACRSRVVRQQDYRLIAKTSLFQNIGRAVGPLLAFPVAPFWFGLTAGEMFGRTVGVTSLARQVWHRRLGTAVWGRPRAWWALIRQEYRFTAVLLSTTLIEAFASQMITPLIAATYGAQAAGEYFLAVMLVFAPSALVATGAADAILVKGAEIFHRDPAALPAFTRKAALGLLALGLPASIAIYLIAPYAVPVAFGPKWPHLAAAIQATTFFAVVAFVASPCCRLIAAVNRPWLKVCSDVFRLIGVPLTLYLSQAAGASFSQAVWNLSLFLAAAYLLYFGLTYFAVVTSAAQAQNK